MGGRLLNYLTYLASATLGALRVPKPDIVMTWTDPPPIGLVGGLVARIRRIPFVLSCQDITPEAPVISGDLSNPMAIRLLHASTGHIFRSASAIVSIGEDMNLRLQELGVEAGKIRLIPNWFDSSLVEPSQGESAFRRDHHWDGRFVVMHSGNVGLSQDLDTLIEAAGILVNRTEAEDILIAIVGEGASKRRLEAEVEKHGLSNVEFLPFQPKTALGLSLTAPDVHLISHKAGLAGYQVPSKLYGILASGKPCIAAVEEDSEIAGVVESTRCGIRVDPGNAQQLASAIVGIRGNDLGQMGARGRAALETRFDRRIATSAYTRLLEESAARSGGGATQF